MLGVSSHFSMVNFNARISDAVQKHIDKEILRAKGVKLKDLEKLVEGSVEVELKDLQLKNKVLWSKTVKLLKPELQKELPSARLEKLVKPKARSPLEAATNTLGLGNA